MAAIFFYLVLKPLSLLPLRVLYVLSDILFFVIYHVIKYRRRVVHENLTRSFPEMTRSEITVLERDFYSHLCDLVVESIRLFSISEEEIRRRCPLINPEVLDPFFQEGRSVMVVAGHYNNWEIGGTVFPLFTRHKVMGIYAPMTNRYFNDRFIETRGRFGLKLVSKKVVTEWFKENIHEPWVVLFGADQSPTHSKVVHWTQFLHQETAVMLGTERYAREYNCPVVYVYVSKRSRGKYQMELKLICDQSAETEPGFITETHTRWLETQIREHPQYWLWTHKRWKRKKDK